MMSHKESVEYLRSHPGITATSVCAYTPAGDQRITATYKGTEISVRYWPHVTSAGLLLFLDEDRTLLVLEGHDYYYVRMNVHAESDVAPRRLLLSGSAE